MEKLHPAVQSVSSGTVHKESVIHPTVQSVPSDTVHKVPGSGSTGTKPCTGVHVLDHSPENKHNRLERENFLKEQLKLSETVLKETQLKEVLEIFLRNFDTCPVNDEDFGASNLLQFHITLLPGSVPVRSRCRPLNPNQETDLNRQLSEWLNAQWSVDFRNLNCCTTKIVTQSPMYNRI